MEQEELLLKIAQDIANDPLSPAGSRPILQISKTAKILIIGQAPGNLAQTSGLSWNDPSGNRLRNWLNLSKEEFYNKDQIALMPMGFCFPGLDRYGGDKPPNMQHAIKWHLPLINTMPNIKLTLLVGSYAQKHYLQKKNYNMTNAMLLWKEFLPKYFILPHPSWRNNTWLKKNTWFESEVIPHLREQVRLVLEG